MTRALLLSATLATLIAWQPVPAAADFQTDLVKLLPSAPDGWKARFKPAWRASGAGGRAFNSWRKLKGQGKVEVIYQWKSFSLNNAKIMMANKSKAKELNWEHVTINGNRWLLKRGKSSTFLQTVIGQNLVVFAQTFDA